MKLYTEEQVIRAIELSDGRSTNEVLAGLTPIELPSNKDTAHLQWIYDRMSNVHGENENYDYMLKFKEIIEQL